MGFSETLNQLHAAIYADPDADEPRLAYARHLQPVSPEPAELIRLQVERLRADLTAGRMWSTPGQRERDLVKKHGRDLAQLVEPYARAPRHDPRAWGYELNRGFVEYLRTDAGVFTELGEQLLRLGPIRHLELVADGTPLAEVLARPELARLISLDLPDWQMGDAGAAAVAACPHLTSLVQLGLRMNRIGEKGLEALAASPTTRRLVMIDLRNNPDNSQEIAVDQTIQNDSGPGFTFEPTELGKRLEARFGHLSWLHPRETLGADRFHIAEVARRRDRAA